MASSAPTHNRIAGTLIILVLAALTLVAAPGACAAEPVTMTSYTSKSQEMEWGYRSHWKQPWRSYMETVPAQRLLDAIGINFNVSNEWAGSTAKLLSDSGFSRARVEFGWNSVEYDNPEKLNAAAKQRMRSVLGALRDNGIRPLILLNANSGEPCPVKYGSVTLAAAASSGAREIKIAAADVGKVTAGRTGISDGGIAARYLFKSVAADGTVQLSRPLGKSLAAGTLQIATLRFEPFRAERLRSGSANPAFEETMRGWLSYVAAVTQEAKAILGSDQFDVEVWNELGFGSEFLSVENYYSPGIEEGRYENEKAILTRTIGYVRNAANGITGVGVGNGFSNERPWDAGSTSPVGLTAIDKHPYKGLVRFPSGAPVNGNRPLNGLGQLATATRSNDQWNESFVPTYDAFFPEYWLSGIQTETLVRDLAPTPSFIYETEHGRTSKPAGGSAPEVWITEVNLDPTEGPTSGLSKRDAEHIKAKTTLRYIAAFVNKGVTNLDLYAASDGNYSLINQGFFDALRSAPNSYPGTARGGEITESVRRMTSTMAGAAAISSPRSLALKSLTDYESKVQFQGDGTAAHPPLYDRDVFAFLPFQVDADEFVVPVYVMTRNVAKVYQQGSTDPARFDLPEQRYRMTIGGVRGASAQVSATDPLSGQSVPVEVVARGSDQVTVEMRVTDSPRMLSIEDGGPPVDTGDGDGGGGEEGSGGEGNPGSGEEGGSGEEPGGAEEPSDPAPEPQPEPEGEVTTPDPETMPEGETFTPAPPKLHLAGGGSLLRNKQIRVVASCRSKCKLRVSGALRVGNRRFPLASPRGAVVGNGGTTTIKLRLDPRAAALGRKAVAKGSRLRAEATVEAQTDPDAGGAATSRTLAVRIG